MYPTGILVKAGGSVAAHGCRKEITAVIVIVRTGKESLRLVGIRIRVLLVRHRIIAELKVAIMDGLVLHGAFQVIVLIIITLMS